MPRYADVVDVADVSKIVGTNYLYNSPLLQSSVIRRAPMKTSGGTQVGWVDEKLFQDDSTGQAIGVDTEISLKSKVQTKYQIPIAWRGDGAEMDDIYEEISPKVKKDTTAQLSDSISIKSAKMINNLLIKVIDGVGLYMAGLGESAGNYNDTDSTQVSAPAILETRNKRGDQGTNGGVCILRAAMYNKLAALGLVAQSINTLGFAKSDQIVMSGNLGTMLGYEFIITDEIALSGTDYLTYFVDPQSLILMGGGAPEIDAVQRKERGFQDIIKFKVGAGIGFEGLSWTLSQNSVVTDAQIASAASWSLAKVAVKYVPAAVLQTPAPTF